MRVSVQLFSALACAVLGLLARPAAATIVGGGGGAGTDCLAVFDASANYPPTRPRSIHCTDGAPCDADGIVNGSCQFQLSVCANSAQIPHCTPSGVQSISVDHAHDNGDPKFDPAFQALQTRIDQDIFVDRPTSESRCTAAPTNIVVKVAGPFGNDVCRRGRKRVRMITLSPRIAGKVYKDTDRFELACDPASAGCDPHVLYASTFDRIQRQVFNQSCALSSCHDSQTHQANMVLETGASYGNLVGDGSGVTPTNPNAAGAGWKRVLPGDTGRSFLYHKITADLPPGYGQPMPLGRPQLDQSLIDVIRCWIEQNAPPDGWQDCP